MSGKKNWGAERMDGHLPPPVVEAARSVSARFWKKKYECPKAKGHHAWQLIVPEHGRRDRAGRLTDIDPEQYYQEQDEKRAKQRAEDEARRIAQGLSKYRWRSYWWDVARWWKCVHCGKQEADHEEQPKKKIREHIWGVV